MAQTSMSVKITKRLVDSIRVAVDDFYVFDSDLIGFGIRVRKSGGMSYIVRYRAGSGRAAPVRRVTIANVGKITPEQARTRAKEILASVVRGADPARERTVERKALTVASLIGAFLEHTKALKKPTTYAQYAHMLNVYILPELGGRPAASINIRDITAIHFRLKQKTTTANRVRDIVSSMYGWASKRANLLPRNLENPAAGIEKYREPRRERFLTTDELQRLGAAIREAEVEGLLWEPDPNKKLKHAPKAINRRVKIDPAVAAAIRLFILTGARLREILNLTWDMVDLERGLLLLPESKTGDKTIILNAPAQRVLSDLPRTSRFVIPGRGRVGNNGKYEESPRSDLNRPWRSIRKRAGLDGQADNPRLRLRIHDLRHTHASIGVGASLGLPIVGKLLGHTQTRTTERYVHLDTDPLRRASDKIGELLISALDATGDSTPRN